MATPHDPAAKSVVNDAKPAQVWTVVGLFADAVCTFVDHGVTSRAFASGDVTLRAMDLREHAVDKHRTVDDTPAGGGPGMILRVDVVERALDAARGDAPAHVVMLDAAGARFDDAMADRLALQPHVVLLCGRYEGFDARVEALVDERVSIGDFVLTGGEVAAAVLIDATVRKRAGVLGNQASLEGESHRRPRLEHRQYTKPKAHRLGRIPEVLQSGNHALIDRARRRDALLRTAEVRPDYLQQAPMSPAEQKLVDDASLPILDPSPIPESP